MSGSSPPVDIQRFGLSIVHTPPNAAVDIVFLHGLNGHPQKTFTSENSRIFWPSELLPQTLGDQKDKIRVLTYGYDADITSLGGSGVTKDRIHNLAEGLVADLVANRRRRGALERPIVFVAHSLGGLVVKRALIWSNEVTGTKTEHLRSVFTSTYGILFFGTPHKGADIATWGTRLEKMAHAIVPKVTLDTAPQLIEALKINSETLVNIDRQFAQLLDNFHIYFFHEAKPTNMKGTLKFIVEEDSAAPTLPDVERAAIQADHQHMVKFEAENSPGFEKVADGIYSYAEEAPRKISSRWASEKLVRRTAISGKLKENYGDYVLDPLGNREGSESSSGQLTPGSSTLELGHQAHRKSKSSAKSSRNGSVDVLDPSASASVPEYFFIKPPGFHPNTYFVGMEKELKILDQRLFDKQRRKVGPASVLLHGQPGVGKSHVATQYVFKNQDKFPSGIFWVNAILTEAIKGDFWRIYQNAVAKANPELIEDSRESFVEVVKSWFQQRHEWLMVFDDVGDSEEELHDLLQFIPESPNSSLLFISRSRRLETMEKLLKPWPIRVAPLKDDQGQALLFKEIGIKKPRPPQIKAANELSKKVGGLPLALTAIAKRLADTREPIERFHMKSYAEDPRIGGTYRLIMDDLIAHNYVEALNLINIICFLGPHIPVEMINMGLRALRADKISVKTSEEGSDADINVTFSILMRHALIERNEPDDSDSRSSSRDSMSDHDFIEVVCVQTVVQQFWSDALDDARTLPKWLALAVRLFKHSFHEANRKINASTKAARVSDYRMYLVHGRKLLDHTHVYDRRNRRLEHIREELNPVLKEIHEEIVNREPSSSQESVSQRQFQDSIFDRAGSTSSSGYSDEALNHPPPPPLPGQNQYGFPEHQRSSESPASLHSPQYRKYLNQNSHAVYFSDDEDGLGPYPMLKGPSETTVRPRSDSLTSQEAGWQKVAGSRTPAMPHVNYKNAEFRPSASPKTGSNAIALLNESIMKHSPPRGRPTFWQRAWSRGSSTKPEDHTWANVVSSHSTIQQSPARETTSAPAQHPYLPPRVLSPHSPGRDVGAPSIGSENERRAGSVLNPPSAPFQSLSRDSSGGLPVIPDSGLSHEGFVHSQQAENTSFQSDPEATVYQYPGFTGVNPDPLPYESNVTVLPMPAHMRPNFTDSPTSTGSRPSSRPPTNPDLHPYQSFPLHPPPVPYPVQATAHVPGSQPMSRDNSSRSHNSDPSITHAPPSNTSIPVKLERPPRARRPDGSPLSKSPKYHESAPLPQHVFSPAMQGVELNPRPPASASLAGTHGWANPNAPIFYPGTHRPQSGPAKLRQSPHITHSPFSPPPSGPASIPASTSPTTANFPSPPSAGQPPGSAVSDPMARSSSGPGFVVQTNQGLGIMSFGDNTLTFGEAPPVNITAAKQRVLDLKRRSAGLSDRDPNARRVPAARTVMGPMSTAMTTKTGEVRRASDQMGLVPGTHVGAYNYASSPYQGVPPHTSGQIVPLTTANSGNPQTLPWGYSSGYGPGSLHPYGPSEGAVPMAPVVGQSTGAVMPGLEYTRMGAGPGSGAVQFAPYPEQNHIPSEAGSLVYSAMAEQASRAGRQRGNSAPESPGWRGATFWGR